ncbi:HtaA domain-containing protein [Corynebacterium aquilae]|uniref:HtaA domain-containing protein n=1 Tax=Corynebacterium aquilae TaxID=203263 RepID=UPI000953208A|nr:HtaA domain-containing protein [Corynebacterium aquilae]
MTRVTATARSGMCLSGAVIAAMALSPFIAPQAHAATCGTFEWALKDSFRSYLKSPIAKGGWNTNGVGDNGSQFVFDIEGINKKSADEATLELPGELSFYGHEEDGKYLLDITMSDWKVHVHGSTAEIIADYQASSVDPGSLKPKEPISGDDETIATIQLNNTPNFDSGEVSLAGTTKIADGGLKMFGGFYTSEDQFANTFGEVNAAGCASSSVSGDSKSSGTSGGTSGAKTQELRIWDTDSDDIKTIKELNNAMFASGESFKSGTSMMDNADALAQRIRGGKPATTASAQGSQRSGDRTTTNTGTQPKAGGAGENTDATPAIPTLDGANTAASGNTTTTGGTDSAATTAGASTAGQGAATGGAECAAGDVKAVTSTAMRWGVKSSFLSYISGSIAKGAWATSNTTYNQGQFNFSGAKGAVNTAAKSGSLGYTGGVRFSGHGGKLDLMIANPEIVFNGSRGSLVATVASSDMSGKRTDFGRVALADLAFSSLNVTPTSVSGTTSQVTLTPAGSQAFAGFYDAGTALAPLSFNAALGGAADCAAAQGSGASGAAIAGVSTGTNASEVRAEGTAQAEQAGLPVAGESGGDAADIAAPQLPEQGAASKNFKIKNSGESQAATTAGLDPVTAGLLVAAAFIVGGGAISSFALRNPA